MRSNLTFQQGTTGVAQSAWRTKQYATLEKFVKHREYCYNSVYPKRMEVMTAISTLKRLLDFYRFSSPIEFSKVLLKQQDALRLLIPGINSRYHAGAKKTVNALIDFSIDLTKNS